MLPTRSAAAVVLLVPVSACAGAPAASDLEADLQAIEAVRDQEIAAFSAGDVEGLLAVLTSDADILPPNEPALAGVEAVRPWVQELTRQFDLHARMISSSVSVLGDYAIERYAAELSITPKAGGETVREMAKGIHVYRRQPDGSWRIQQDVWNSDGPPGSGAAPGAP